MNYISPEAFQLDLRVEGQVMLTQSDYDEKHNTEILEWDDVVDL